MKYYIQIIQSKGKSYQTNGATTFWITSSAFNWRMPFCNRCDSNHLTLITKKVRLSLKILIVFLNHFQLQKWLHTGNYYFEFIMKIASSFWFSLFVLQNKNRKSKPNFYFLVLVLKRKKQQKGNVSSSDIGRMTKRASICLRKALYTGINPCTNLRYQTNNAAHPPTHSWNLPNIWRRVAVTSESSFWGKKCPF